jgi:regulator of protease activity HflC (stomatin/prohibitin superfamily)
MSWQAVPEGGRETRLVSKIISGSWVANEIFGGKHAANETPVLLIPSRRACCPFITIPSGMYGLVQVAGRDVDDPKTGRAVWSPGFHWASPFPCNQRRISHLVTKQAIVFDTPIRGCKTSDDVTVTIDICVNIRIMGDPERGEDPNLVREFVHKLGPVELGRQLKDAQDERVRALARSVKHTEVYALRSQSADGRHSNEGKDEDGVMLPPKAREMAAQGVGAGVPGKGIEMTQMGGGAGPRPSGPSAEEKSVDVTEDMKDSLNHQFNRYGVQIIDVAIQRVRLPPKFEKQMEERTTYGAIIEEQKMRQLSEMQLIKQGEEVQTVQQKNKEDQEKEQEVGTRAVAEERKKLDAVRAETAKLVAGIKEDEIAQVRQIRATSNLKVQELDSETIKVLTQHDAKAKAESERMVAEADAFVMKRLADAELEEEKCRAQAKAVVADAEGKAAKKLNALRHYKLQKQQIAMYSALAENPNVVVTGTGGKGQSLLADMMVSQKQSQILLQVDGTRAK